MYVYMCVQFLAGGRSEARPDKGRHNQQSKFGPPGGGRGGRRPLRLLGEEHPRGRQVKHARAQHQT